MKLRASIHDPAQPGRDGYFIPTSLPWIEILKSLHEKNLSYPPLIHMSSRMIKSFNDLCLDNRLI